MFIRWRITVTGKVQGVGFRKATQEEARKLQLTGFVQNLSDGAVLIEAEGTKAALAQLASWCQHGPPLALIKAVNIEEVDRATADDFDIRY